MHVLFQYWWLKLPGKFWYQIQEFIGFYRYKCFNMIFLRGVSLFRGCVDTDICKNLNIALPMGFSRKNLCQYMRLIWKVFLDNALPFHFVIHGKQVLHCIKRNMRSAKKYGFSSKWMILDVRRSLLNWPVGSRLRRELEWEWWYTPNAWHVRSKTLGQQLNPIVCVSWLVGLGLLKEKNLWK